MKNTCAVGKVEMMVLDMMPINKSLTGNEIQELFDKKYPGCGNDAEGAANRLAIKNLLMRCKPNGNGVWLYSKNSPIELGSPPQIPPDWVPWKQFIDLQFPNNNFKPVDYSIKKREYEAVGFKFIRARISQGNGGRRTFITYIPNREKYPDKMLPKYKENPQELKKKGFFFVEQPKAQLEPKSIHKNKPPIGAPKEAPPQCPYSMYGGIYGQTFNKFVECDICPIKSGCIQSPDHEKQINRNIDLRRPCYSKEFMKYAECEWECRQRKSCEKVFNMKTSQMLTTQIEKLAATRDNTITKPQASRLIQETIKTNELLEKLISLWR